MTTSDIFAQSQTLALSLFDFSPRMSLAGKRDQEIESCLIFGQL